MNVDRLCARALFSSLLLAGAMVSGAAHAVAPFAFTNLSSSPPNRPVLSEFITVSGLSGPAGISLAGDPSAQYRIEGQSLTRAAGTVNNGDHVWVKMQSSPTAGAARSATLTIDGTPVTWTVTTATASTTPDPFSFTDVSGATPHAQYVSNQVTITGLASPASITYGPPGGTRPPEYQINAKPYASKPGIINNGDKLRLRARAPGAGRAQPWPIQVGGREVLWTITAVNSPATFVSTEVTGATRGTLYSYLVVAQDPEGRPLKITAAAPLPSWLTLGPSTAGPGANQYKATLSGTPGNAQAVSPQSVSLRVDDRAGGIDLQDFDIVVANAAPAFDAAPPGSDSVKESVAYSYQFTTQDADRANGDTCALSAPTLPAWLTATIDNANCKVTLSGTPTHANAGDNPVSLVVKDYVGANGGAGGTATLDFTIHVLAPPVVAANDTFYAVGNTRLNVGHVGGAPAVTAPTRTSLMDNDTYGAGLTPGVDIVATLVAGTLTPGAILNLSADGSFDLTPPAGATTAGFTYQIYDGSSTASATVTVNYSNRIWYANNLASAGSGTSGDPFANLANAATAANAAGDTIYVYNGDGTHNKQNAGAALAASNQRLIGQGAALTSPSLNVDGSGAIPIALLPAGSRPQIGNGAGNAITVTGAGSSVQGLDIDSASGHGISASVNFDINDDIIISGVTGTGLFVNGGTFHAHGNLNVSATGRGIDLRNSAVSFFDGAITINTSAGHGFFAFQAGTTTMLQNCDVDATGGAAVVLSSVAAGIGGWKFGTLSATSSGGSGIDIGGASGNFTSQSVTVTNASTQGILVLNSSGAYDFGDTSVTDTAIGAGPSGHGIYLHDDLSATFTFKNVNVVADAGIGLLTSNVGGLTVLDTSPATSRIEATGRAAISLSGTTIVTSLLVDSVKSTSSTGNGVLYGAGTSGPSPQFGTTEVTHSAGAAVLLQGSGGVRLGTLNITNTGAGDGAGLVATSGALASSAGTISTGAHRAIDIANSGIGATNLILTSVSANSVDHAIVLNNTGALGGLVVAGTGTAGTGGTISGTTDDSILLTNTKGVSLSYMIVQGSQKNGINGTSVNGLNMTGMSFTNNGSSSFDNGIALANLTGTANWSAVSVTGSADNNVWIHNNSGTLDSLSITGASHFDSLGATFGANSILLEIQGTATMTSGLIDGATFQNNKPARGITVDSSSSAGIGDAVSNAFVVQNCVFTNNGLHASFQQASSGNLTFKFLNNGTPAQPMVMPNTTSGTSHAVNLFTSSVSTGTLRGRISGNRIGNPAVAGSGSAIGNGIGGNLQGGNIILLIDSNVIRQVPQQRGIELQFIGSTATGRPIAQQDVTITNNDVNPQDSTGFPLAAIYVSADNQGSPTRVRADIRNNTVPSSPPAFDISTEYIYLDEQVAPAEVQLLDTGPVSATCNAQISTAQTAGTAGAAAGCALITGSILTPP